MRRAVLGSACVGLAMVVLAGCNRPWRDGYFDKGLHKVTQAEVLDMLGPPHTSKTTLLGEESVWTYRYAMSDEEMDPMGGFGNTASKAKDRAAAMVGQGSDTGKHPTLRCQKYTLKFDQNKILQQWKRDTCGLPAQTARP